MASRLQPRLFRFAAVTAIILLCFAMWGGWYINEKGFSKKWRIFVTEEFRKQGIELDFRALTLDPFHGIVARDLKIFEGPAREHVVARVDRVVLDINYAGFLHGDQFLNALDLRDADLSFQVNPEQPESASFEVRGLSARVLLPPHQIYVARAHANVLGIDVSASGRLVNPEAFKRKVTTSSPERVELVQKGIEFLDSLQMEAEPPRLDIQFAGDLADPDGIYVDAALVAHRVGRPGYMLRQLNLVASYRDRVFTLTQLHVDDGRGVLKARGRLDTRPGDWEVAANSGLDLQKLATAFELTGQLERFEFEKPPYLEVNARGNLGTGEILLVGSAASRKFNVGDIPFEGAAARFAWDGSCFYVRDFRLEHATGAISGDFLQKPEDFRGKVLSTIDPTALLPFTSGKTEEFLRDWKFSHSPEIVLSASGPRPDPNVLTIDGHISLGETSFRGVGITSGETAVHTENRAATYRDFHIKRPEGEATGTFTYDFGNKLVRLEKVRGNLVTTDVATWIHPNLKRDVAPYKFKKPPQLRIDGIVHYEGTKGTDLVVRVDAPHGMDYVFLKKNLSSPRIAGRLLFTDGLLRIRDLAGTLYGGAVRGESDISLEKNSQKYSASIEADGVDFASLTKLYFGYEGSAGRMSGFFNFTGRGDDARRLKGNGAVHVENGDVFAIPFLGPLSGILNNIVPGMGVSIAREASSTFSVADGAIRTDDFRVKGKGFEMLGEGRLFFLDDKMDFNIRINARGVPGVLLFPVSKLFEFTSKGSLSDPEWRPKNLPTF